MYEAHESFPQPQNEDVPVWRYVGFTKFVDLLRTSSLFFGRADKLGDPYEGSWPKKCSEAWKETAKRAEESAAKKGIPFTQPHEVLSRAFRSFTKNHFVSCWHMNPIESDAMWKLYLPSDEGIAIRSRYRLLRQAFDQIEEQIFVGQVRYIDYETDAFSIGNVFNPYMHKRGSFSHENEVRAILTRYPEQGPIPDSGIHLHVDLPKLIEEIYVAPFCSDMLRTNVDEVVRRFGFSIPVIRSALERPPEF